MKTVVETLELQHRALEKEVAMLDGALAARSLGGVRQSLDRLFNMLDAHLKLEHTEFYPPFLARAATDADAHRTVALFHENLKRIAEGILAFFARWKGELTNEKLDVLKGEWRTTLKILAGRLRDEEKILHPIYRRLFPTPA